MNKYQILYTLYAHNFFYILNQLSNELLKQTIIQ